MYLDKDDNPSIGIIQDAVKKHLSYGIAKVSQKVTNDKDQKSFWMFVRARFYEWQHNYPKAIEHRQLRTNKSCTNIVLWSIFVNPLQKLAINRNNKPITGYFEIIEVEENSCLGI